MKKQTFLLLLFCTIGLPLSLLAQKKSKTPAAVVDPFRDIETYIEKARQDWLVPGVGLAVVRNGKIIYAKGFGFKDLEQKTAVTANTQFAIGSCSKAFTAFGVCQLAQDGKISLNKPLVEYLPDFKLHDEYAGEKLTPADMLSHISGLPRHDFAWYGSPRSREELYKSIPLFEPTVSFRQQWQYNNFMFMTAGYLIEKMSGQSWEEYTRAKILGPLGMKETNFSVADLQKTTDHALPYGWEDKPMGKVKKLDFRNIDAMGPAGSINSSPNEMAKWVTMLLRKGKYEDQTLINPDMHQELFRPRSIASTALDSSYYTFYGLYGLGWFITDYRGHLRHDHGGNIDGFSANVALYPRDSLGIIVLTNMNGTGLPGVVRNYVADRLLGLPSVDWNDKQLSALKKALIAGEEAAQKVQTSRKLDTKPSHALSEYIGKYKNEAYGIIEITASGDTLGGKFNDLKLKVSHFHYDIFSANADGANIQFSALSNLKGEIETLEIELQPGVKPLRFDRFNEAIKSSKNDLEKYVGDYDLMGTNIKCFLRGEILFVNVPGQTDYELVPVGPHKFDLKVAKGYQLIFAEEAGKIISATFDQPNGKFTAKRKP
ncbi:MAG TPA: serine hydrolase [Haliscomenobacter sp.]|uniref:serine hydrolase n=1 Tax=Haliscomenobacter sp. TaxID=2717303 RepID=UPI002B9B871D|nr:serine hydrolase [Haliscomenobacter sp.]HOY18385.1 serine hydrolase [Haliscomenobacter sp.]